MTKKKRSGESLQKVKIGSGVWFVDVAIETEKKKWLIEKTVDNRCGV